MNDKLGIIGITDTSEQNQIINEVIKDCEYELINIEKEDELEDVGGLIIFANQIMDYIEVCQWLVSLRNRKPLFVWIVSKEYNENMMELYFKLATNAIIEVVQSGKNNQFLMKKVKNAIDFQKKLLSYKYEKNQDSTFHLDSQSLKIIVEDKEIYLTRLEFKLFTILNDNLGKIVSYDQLIEIIWPTVDSKKHKYRLANLVFNVRKKLRRQTAIDIQIIRTKGYLLKLK
ncbi:winged helix-turn-helix domain-containing protein [Enterococcus plantarum]|uniref:winged helix-turn-helix domain-containing protein n=1 Tax=Enterococcus plantarum TaxID=1077675 RepID=UPI001A905484|nr:winged helix-turn-helix domain-containing protein [Enterococcus plantarum]MBO0468668.1 winged helix-turn-helix domain-containing protein [Enterococcus plantarum]